MPAIPDYQTLMLPVLRLAANGEITIPRAVEALAQEFSLTPSQLAERIPSGRSALLNSGPTGLRHIFFKLVFWSSRVAVGLRRP